MRRRCPFCKQLVESKIKTCPHCGNPLGKENNPHQPDDTPFELPSNPVSEPPTPKKPVSFKKYNLLSFIMLTLALGYLACAFFLPMFLYVENQGGVEVTQSFSYFDHLLYIIRIFPEKWAAFDPAVFTVSATFLWGDFLPMFAIFIIPIFFILWFISWIKSLIALIKNKFPKTLQKRGGLGKSGQFVWATWTFVVAYLCVFVPYLVGLWLIALGHGGNDVLKAILHMFVDETHFQGLSIYQFIFIGLYIVIVLLSIFRYYYKKSLREKGVLQYRVDV